MAWASLTALEGHLYTTAIPCLYWAYSETLFCTVLYCMVVYIDYCYFADRQAAQFTAIAGTREKEGASKERCDTVRRTSVVS